jgi:hypothetical protein
MNFKFHHFRLHSQRIIPIFNRREPYLHGFFYVLKLLLNYKLLQDSTFHVMSVKWRHFSDAMHAVWMGTKYLLL